MIFLSPSVAKLGRTLSMNACIFSGNLREEILLLSDEPKENVERSSSGM